MDTCSISFLQKLHVSGIDVKSILKRYEILLIPYWVFKENDGSETIKGFLEEINRELLSIFIVEEKDYFRINIYKDKDLEDYFFYAFLNLANIKTYFCKYIRNKDTEYNTWINELYIKWEAIMNSTTGKAYKKNAGDVSITVLSFILIFGLQKSHVSILTQDRDPKAFIETGYKKLKDQGVNGEFSFKTNDVILMELYRNGKLDESRTKALRNEEKRVDGFVENEDKTVSYISCKMDNEKFLNFISKENTHILF